MIFRIRGVDLDIEVDEDNSSTLVIENKVLLRSVINDLMMCINGNETFDLILEKDFKPLKFNKNVLLFQDYFQYEKIFRAMLAEIIKDIEYYLNFDQDIKNGIEYQLYGIYKLVEFIKNDFDVELTYNDDVKVSSLIKLLNFQIDLNSYPKPIDKLYLLLDLIAKYSNDKLIIFLNLSFYFTQDEIKEIIKYCKYKKIIFMVIESVFNDIIYTDHSYHIDNDLDEFKVT